MIRQLQQRGIHDERVLSAMMRVPRQRFVPPHLRDQAYADEALTIGQGQTISQPYMVAIMSQELDLSGGERVLEIGTGSGYQTAVLSELVRRPRRDAPAGAALPDGQVCTVERIGELGETARQLLAELGCDNVAFRVGDGSRGWPEHAPYDAVLLTAGAPAPPAPLIEQLAVGGRFVGPVGPAGIQTLVKWVRQADGTVLRRDLLECRFVRLIGSEGWEN